MKSPKIAVVIVTYNRKELLVRCLTAIHHQSFPPKAIYIIDNNSTDGTEEHIKNSFPHPKIEHIYIKLKKNIGGAGGFHHGLKTAFESNEYDGFILMDDDGMPDNKCFFHIVSHTPEYNYINALVVSETNHNEVAFPRGNHGFNRRDIEKEANIKGLILNYASPFNGTYISKELVSKVGYPIPELFFQGDEINYHKRALKSGFTPVTTINAIHYHPCKVPEMYKFGIGRISVKLRPQDTPLRIFCNHRNMVYNRFTLRDYIYIFLTYFLYSYIYLLKQRSKQKYLIFNKAVYDGLIRKLDGHLSFLND